MHQDGFTVKSMQILFHHFKIPSIVEIWIARVQKSHEFKDFTDFNTLLKWDQLGHIVPSNNHLSNFKARELKSIPIQFKANLVKLIFQKPFANNLNLWRQVSFLEVRFFGSPPYVPFSSSPEKITSPLKFDISPISDLLSLIADKKKTYVLQENHIRAEELKVLHETLRDMVKEAQKLDSLKNEACKKENYVQAEQFKQQLKSLIHLLYKKAFDHGFIMDPSTGKNSLPSEQALTNSPITLSPRASSSTQYTSKTSSMSRSISPLFPEQQKYSPESSNFLDLSTTLSSPLKNIVLSNSDLSHQVSPQRVPNATFTTPKQNHASGNMLFPINSSDTIAPQFSDYSFPLSKNHSPDSLLSPIASKVSTQTVKLTPTLAPEMINIPSLIPAFEINRNSSLKFSEKIILNSISPPLSPDQMVEFAACIELVGPEIVSFFLAKEFETKEKGLREIYEILCDKVDSLDAMKVLKGGFLFIEKTVMDARERIACWSFQVWRLLFKWNGLNAFWNLTHSYFPDLLNRAGDFNSRVSKAAHELAIEFITHHPSSLIPLIIKSFPPTVQWRGIKARLQLIADTLDDIGLSIYDPKELKALVSDYIAHTHHEVRELATQVLVCLAQWFDADALDSYPIPQRFHRQALRNKLESVQRRSISVFDLPISPQQFTLRRSLTPTGTHPKKKTWNRWLGKTNSPLKPAPINSNLDVQLGSTSTTNTMKCIFCEEQHSDFNNPENLDIHYLKECPLLSECPQCDTIIELTQYREHHFHECSRSSKFVSHLETDGICPLCGTFFHGKSKLFLLRHLLTGKGCPKSKRKPKLGLKYTSKLNSCG
ncbi:hypothetical protein HMI55_000648 [Coelomomyces lativittatus]|nr:hypothetical protein HMI55_000648 [Coelomomyces lativittatus]